MKKIGLLALVLFSSASSFGSDFYTVDEYLSLNPEQKKLSRNFYKIVHEPGKPIKTEKVVKIAIIYPGDQLSDYWDRSVKSLKSRLKELNIKFEINEYFTRIGQYRQQTIDIKKAIDSDPDFLIFTLDAKKHEKLISKVLTNKRIKIILQNITTPLKAWNKKQPFLYVGFDHAIGSKILADYYIDKYPDGGEYSIFYCKNGYVNDYRSHYFVKYLNKNSKFKLHSSFYTESDFEKTKRGVISLRNDLSSIKFIYACSTDIAIGLVSVLNTSKKNVSPLVNGWGGGTLELNSIVRGELDVTVMRMNDDNGVAMAEAIKLSVLGKSNLVPTIFSGQFELVKKGISKERLTQLQSRAFRYSGVSE
jgi:autoinducer 2-binding protein LuxP